MQSNKTTIEFSPKFQPLFKPYRYKILKGGRAGMKSWSIARALLLIAAQSQKRILCCRQIQKSIKDSSHQLLKDQIIALGLSSFYEVQNTTIIGQNGSLFSFEGLEYNIENIRSKEGYDVAWVEEAQAVPKSSWDILIPTIRKEGSEIWMSFNPMLESDETYQRFVLSPPTNSIIIDVSWRDNPWFPDVLKQEMLDLKERDYDAYLNVWEGKCRITLEGAVYAKEIQNALTNNRITTVNYNPRVPVHTFWDLGYSDKTAIWFVQRVGLEYRLIDYLEASQQSIPWYAVQLQQRQYVYGTCWLPHDAQQKQLSAAGQSIQMQLQALGYTVKIVPHAHVSSGINMARTIFANCWFDEKKCELGLKRLKGYRYEVDVDSNQTSRLPIHDENSHGADAFRYFAVGFKDTDYRQTIIRRDEQHPLDLDLDRQSYQQATSFYAN